MQRIEIGARADWKERVENLGLDYHSTNGKPYWMDGAYYHFTPAEIELLEGATNELWERCLEAVQFVIDRNRFADLQIPEVAIPHIIASWEAEVPSIYGRFDLAYDGIHAPKMLEFNADTPTALLEAAVVQWYWLLDRFPRADQFNSIWDKLVAKWRELKDGHYLFGDVVHFAHLESTEDLMTVAVLRDTAQEAGIATKGLHMKQIGWHNIEQHFVDQDNRQMRTLFKLYPWEWMVHEPFGANLLRTPHKIQVIEPIWKMVLSNKGILAILWEMFPDHPYLLKSYIGRSQDLRHYAKKPLLSREGANVMLKSTAGLVRQEGEYGSEGFVFQELGPVPNIEGKHPVIGSWIVTDQGACGIGIRESDGPITDNLSRFVPHVLD